jgi:hypothetical protein
MKKTPTLFGLHEKCRPATKSYLLLAVPFLKVLIWVFWQTAYTPKPTEESTPERPRCRTEMEEMMYSLNLLAAERAKSFLIIDDSSLS